MNIELLTRVRDHIADHPDRFSMRDWYIVHHDCRTTACIAGWASMLSSGFPDFTEHDIDLREHTHSVACRVLQITVLEGDALFYRRNWPKPYRTEEGDEVAVAIRLLDAVIERTSIWWSQK